MGLAPPLDVQPARPDGRWCITFRWSGDTVRWWAGSAEPPNRLSGKGYRLGKRKGLFRVGASGWQYDHWKGGFYPPELKKSQWFSQYTKHFDTVEVNNTFHIARWGSDYGQAGPVSPRICPTQALAERDLSASCPPWRGTGRNPPREMHTLRY